MLARGTRGTGGSVRYDVPFHVISHPIDIGRKFRAIDDDDLVPCQAVQVYLSGPELGGMMKLDLVERPGGLIAQIHVTAGYFPLRENIMPELSKNVEKA